MKNEYDKIEKYINARIDDPEEPVIRNLIADFALLWNQYERTIYDENHSIDAIKKKIKQYHFENIDNLDSLYERIKSYIEFRDHKFTPEDIIKMFDRKNNSNEVNKKNITMAMEKNSNSDKIYVLLFIAARVRNNMFHGTKGTWDLHKQKDLFKICNEVLMNTIKKAEKLDE